MKSIATINLSDVSENEAEEFVRIESARAVLFDDQGRIALMRRREGYYKLPGGGIKDGEERIDALRRECLEETGCEIDILFELGMIEELRREICTRNVSYGWTARVLGKKGAPSLEQDEIDQGLHVVWVENIERAIECIESSKRRSETGRSIRARDSSFLREAQCTI